MTQPRSSRVEALNQMQKQVRYDSLPDGSELANRRRRRGGYWKLGSLIGRGAFGAIYLVSPSSKISLPNNNTYVAKVEPISSGPLFVEQNFYLRAGQKKLIDEWKEARQLRHLGMPTFYGFLTCYIEAEQFRFLFMERYGLDVWSLFLQNQRRLPLKTVLPLAIQVLDVLEYIHYQGYVHADIKGANILLGLGEDGKNKVYLVDFGLACTFVDQNGCHKPEESDKRKANNGTIEYTSRDAHIGAHSRRSDIEMLGYNLVQWLCGKLPWEDFLSFPDHVVACKKYFMSNISNFMMACFKKNAPAMLVRYLNYITGLEFKEKPDYDKLRAILREGISRRCGVDEDCLHINLDVSNPAAFNPAASNPAAPNPAAPNTAASDPVASNPAAPREGGQRSNTENSLKSRAKVQRLRSARSPFTLIQLPAQACDRRTRQKSTTEDNDAVPFQDSEWAEILRGDPDRAAKLLRVSKVTPPQTPLMPGEVHERLLGKPDNGCKKPNEAMQEVMDRRRAAEEDTGTARALSSSSRSSPSPPLSLSRSRSSRNLRTPAMEKIMLKRMLKNMSYYSVKGTAAPCDILEEDELTSHRSRSRTRRSRTRTYHSCGCHRSYDEDGAVAHRTRSRSRSRSREDTTRSTVCQHCQRNWGYDEDGAVAHRTRSRSRSRSCLSTTSSVTGDGGTPRRSSSRSSLSQRRTSPSPCPSHMRETRSDDDDCVIVSETPVTSSHKQRRTATRSTSRTRREANDDDCVIVFETPRTSRKRRPSADRDPSVHYSLSRSFLTPRQMRTRSSSPPPRNQNSVPPKKRRYLEELENDDLEPWLEGGVAERPRQNLSQTPFLRVISPMMRCGSAEYNAYRDKAYIFLDSNY